MKAVVTPYDVRWDGEIYTVVAQLIVIADDENFYHTIYASSTSFNPLLPNWKSRLNSSVEQWAEDNQTEIDQVMFLPDFSLLGL